MFWLGLKFFILRLCILLWTTQKTDLQGNDPSISQLTTKIIHFESQLTSLFVVSTPFKLQPSPNRYNAHCFSYGTKQLTPYGYCTTNYQNTFTPQRSFHVLPYVIYILMIQIKKFSLWTTNVFSNRQKTLLRQFSFATKTWLSETKPQFYSRKLSDIPLIELQ